MKTTHIFVAHQTQSTMAAPTFLYDDACPMCNAYTSAFTKLKWSDRTAFSKIGELKVKNLDLDRGRHEIPLFNPETGEVRYGLDAMTTVIAGALPHLKPLIRNRFFVAALKPLYWLITYNRRIIAGTKPPATGFDCAPDFHLGWRLAYLILAVLIVLTLGTLPGILLAGLGLTLAAAVFLTNDKMDALGHIFTIGILASLIAWVLPGAIGVALAYVVTGGELWRRLV